MVCIEAGRGFCNERRTRQLATSGSAGCGVAGSSTATDSGAAGGGAPGGAAAGSTAAAVVSELRAKEGRRWKSARGALLCFCVAPTWSVFVLSQGEGESRRLGAGSRAGARLADEP